jgi:prepilin-type processing-associated H-X9-DG protein
MQLVETLEHRRLLSATVTETFPGYFEIVGSDANDVIVVSVSQGDRAFTLDGQTFGGADYLTVLGHGGDDLIDVSASGEGWVGASIDGGDGHDRLALNFDGGIWAGAGDDVLDLSDSFRGEVHGDGGADTITVRGECEDPMIHGGDGDDWIDASGNYYRVSIHGGAGNDVIYGSDYKDHLYGDEGADVLYGLGGNDTFHCQDGELDEVHGGGGGANVLYADADGEGSVRGIQYVIYS